ncbi:MAG: pyrroline-5-carboxylate reductase [Opitutaceae bacterium]|nr:pyrroline-5-carboxylate reductase [Opitutaceae bacterium]
MPTHIAFIGAGRMASAMVDGLLTKGAAQPADLACIGSPADNTAQLLSRRTGIALHDTFPALVSSADTVVLACKPQQLAGLDACLAALTAGKLVLSILAGKRLAGLALKFPRARNLIRAMPNTPGQIGAGITGWCALHPPTEADRRIVASVLGSLGRTIEFAEPQLDAVTGLSGSGPAYVFEFAAALRDAGEAAGLPRAAAYQLAVETIIGAGRLMQHQAAVEPEELRNQVTSPNGTTFAGLKHMDASDFRGLIRDTVLAATARSIELSHEG